VKENDTPADERLDEAPHYRAAARKSGGQEIQQAALASRIPQKWRDREHVCASKFYRTGKAEQREFVICSTFRTTTVPSLYT
jgi:hypothetical protein